MSNNIYDILNKFNAVDQQEQQPVQQQPKAKSRLAENMETVEGQLNEKYMGFKKTVAAVKKGGSADNPEAVAAAIGRKKYGKEKFQQAAAAGKKLGEEQGVAEGFFGIDDKIKGKIQNITMDLSDIPGYWDHQAQTFTPEGLAKLKAVLKKPEYVKYALNLTANDYEAEGVAEVAPPGAKAERMVKHIKKGYAKDGALTPKEKSIAYATAWKAHNAGKVEEAVAALSILSRSGMTAEQITEGWEDMMKAVKKQHDSEKGTGKFDKKKDPTTGGTVYTRKYNAKTGETDDTENVTAVKRGRGRPKKSAFESYLNKFADLIEAKDELGAFIQGLDKGSSAKLAPTKQPMGTIKGGVWTPDPPKAGEKGVPLPLPVDEQTSVTGTQPTSAYAKGTQAELNKPTSSARTAPTTKPAATSQTQSTSAFSNLNQMGDYTGISMGNLADTPKRATTPATPQKPARVAGPDQSSAETARLQRYQTTPATPQKPARVAGPDQSSAETARLQRYQSAAAARQKPAADLSPFSDLNQMGDYTGISMGNLPDTPSNTQAPALASQVFSPPVATKPNKPAKPAAKPPAPQRITTTYTGPEGNEGEAQAQQAMLNQPAATDARAEPEASPAPAPAPTQTSAGRTEPAAAAPAPTRPAGIPVQSGTPGINWKTSDGQDVTSRSADEIGDTDPATGEYKPGSYEKRMQQGQKNLDALKNFFGIGRGEKPSEKPLEITPKSDSSFTPDQSQTVAEGTMTNDLEEMLRLAGMEDVLKGGQKKLDKNKNGKLDAMDFAILRGDAKGQEMDENLIVVPNPSSADSIEQAKKLGAMMPAEPGKTDPIKVNEKMCNECGYTMTECGCDSPVPSQDQGNMNVSMNVNSDGNQNITVSAEGEEAVKLAQLLRLAGLGSGSSEAVYQPVEVVVGDEEEIEEEKDDRYHASTTPDVEVFGTDVQLKGGNGDVAGQEKKMTPHGYQFGDNPIAMKETVARDYESIKVRK